MEINLDNIDKSLLNIIQAEFPLHEEPFSVLGQQLGVVSDEVIRRVERLKAGKIIRLIGPVFNARKLGYQTTLIAMKVAAKRLNEAANIMNAHPCVSHCYERDHDFNLWFTMAMPSEKNLENGLHELGNEIQADATVNLPATKVFKIGAYFNLGSGNLAAPKANIDDTNILDKNGDLSPIDRAVINELQQDLPLISRPFDSMSVHLSMNVAEFLNHCRALIQRRIMRRFSASVSHNRLGFVANAMTCWKVPVEAVEAAGTKIARFPEVSHCYERKTCSLWSYNLFAMIHADTKKACEAIAGDITSKTGLDKTKVVLLFSTKEIKKTRILYPV